MKHLWGRLHPLGMMVSTTLGAGLFALPLMVARAGWLLSLVYLVFLTGVIMAAHAVYFEILQKEKGKTHLLGLSKTYFHRSGYAIAFLGVIGGLVLTLVAYLILGTQFLGFLGWPKDPFAALIFFWFLAVLPFALRIRRLVGLEMLAAVVMAGIIFLIAATTQTPYQIFALPSVNLAAPFLPFGVLIFALAGWTAVTPIYEEARERKKEALRLMLYGTVVSAFLYIVFVVGFWGALPQIFEKDGLELALSFWPAWKMKLLAFLGLILLLTSFWPIAWEIKNLLEKDAHWPGAFSAGTAFVAPLFFVLLGVQDFLKTVEFVGGVFLSVEHILIVLLGLKILSLTRLERWGLWILSFVFALGGVYVLMDFFGLLA